MSLGDSHCKTSRLDEESRDTNKAAMLQPVFRPRAVSGFEQETVSSSSCSLGANKVESSAGAFQLTVLYNAERVSDSRL